ncbi:uncharacterized protein T551_01790 [Pneumocystis jirovecii RU7]|uniref:Copper-fist domain-containing protein n=1 Tax=Pneumocystis jirovecii (strain RU7) TaxID=1408657 RepID=A0A0W4ZQ52_PNEJ7|nr:uncharacterized protein T551_01790 [Pneumocystis jirovecii RU7]KTW30507.1 hypothetical protein T551_01790 [Pneumocystis jirovecii RU7]
MVYINNIKYACSSCIRGHRSSLCDHKDRQLFEIKRKGRPVSQCLSTLSTRIKRPFRTKCFCKEYVEKANESPDFQKLIFKAFKKNQKTVLETIENKEMHEAVQNNGAFIKDFQTNVSELNFNGLSEPKQLHFPSNFQMLNNADSLKYGIGAVTNKTCNSDSKVCTQSSDFSPDLSSEPSSDFSSEMLSYYNSQYSNNYIYPQVIGQNSPNGFSTPSNIDFYQTYNKSAYADLDTISNYSYIPSEIKENFHSSSMPVFFDYIQHSKTQNNNINIPESFMKFQTIISDSQNLEIPETYYEFDCSRPGSKCTCTSACQCTNCYTHGNNIVHNTLQNVLPEKQLLDGYIIPQRKCCYMVSGINTHITEP